jgi:hypothetical protein
MAVNESRSMNAEFSQGSIDCTYIQLAPNRGGIVEHVPYDRLTWPRYQHAEEWQDGPFWQAHASRLGLPRENKVVNTGDPRY